MGEEQRARSLAERLADVEERLVEVGERLAALEAQVASDAPAAAGKPVATKSAGKKKAEGSAEEDAA